MTDILEQAKDLLGKTIDPYMEDPYMEGEPREIPYPTLRSFFNLEDGILRELIAEVERLRSLTLDQQYMMDDLDKEITAKDARIKELEAENQQLIAFCKDYLSANERRLKDLIIRDGQIERLEAAFLDHLAARLYYEHYPGVSDAYSWHDYPEDACHSMPKEEFRKKARETLERIKEGGKDDY